MAVADAPLAAPVVGRPRARRVWACTGFVAALVVLAASLVVGSGVTSSSAPTLAERAGAVESVVRCPSCQDLSVGQSNASSAIAVRHEITQDLARGESVTHIEDTLVAQYGPSILLSPPDSGWSAVVWLVPAVAGPLALLAVLGLFWRRGRSLARLRSGAG